MVLFAKRMGGSRAVLKVVPAAILAWACTLSMANAAMYVPDNFADNGGTNLETMVMVKDGSGRLVIGGLFNTVEGQTGYQGVARFNADDSLDTTFKVATDEFVKAIAIQTDGKILIGGQFHYVTPAGGATTTSWGIARLNADGTVDAGFTPAPAGTVKSNHNVRGIAVQSDGKIVIGGYFTLIDGVARNRIARLNADGTLDTTFNVGTGSNGNIEDVKLQSDGKILISGSFTNIQGTDIRGVARLNTDGSLDTTFVPNGGATGVANGAWDGSFPVYQLAVQNDGKILYASGTHTYAGKYHWRMARLNTDGTPDANFNSFVNWWASSIALQNVGGEQKIVVGGDFGVAGQRNVDTNAVEGTDAQRIRVARFNADGTLDTTFDTSNSANSWLWSVLPNDDGTVYIGGKFTSVAGMARRGIARLDELDPTTQVINFQAPDPAVYSALNGSAVTWNPAPPTTSSANLPVTYSSLTPTVCTVNSTTGAVSTAVPTAVTGLCTIQADAAAGQQTINSITYDVAAAPPVQQSIQIDAPPDQSIIFPAQTSPKNVADGAFNVNPVATASSGLAVNYSSLTPTVCTVLGETVTPLTGGVCTIAANQPGGSVGAVAFNAAAQVTQSITLQSGQTIDFPAQTSGTQTIVTGSSFAIAPTATATSNLPVTYSSLTPAVCTVTGTSVQVLSSGTCTIAADQAGDTYFTPATQMSQSVQVTALPRTVAAVPTLETWALGLLATLLGVLGFRRRGSAQ